MKIVLDDGVERSAARVKGRVRESILELVSRGRVLQRQSGKVR